MLTFFVIHFFTYFTLDNKISIEFIYSFMTIAYKTIISRIFANLLNNYFNVLLLHIL